MDVQTSSIIHVYSTTVRKIIYNVFRNNLCWSLFVVSSSCAHSEILKKCEMLPISIDKQGVKKNRNIQSIQYGKPLKAAEIVQIRRW